MTNKPTTIEELLQLPGQFTIKIMGVNVPELVNEVDAIISRHCEGFEPQRDITTRPSSKGNFITVNANIYAESKEQLDKIYLELNNHSLVKITL